jgi:putative nucleotidyltransferase with HDIG domain
MPRDFKDVAEAYDFMGKLGAPEKLIRHVILVGEAAELLIDKLKKQNVQFDEKLVRLGVALHDVGKILHPEELNLPGKKHEREGESLLLANGLNPRLARCCVSHGQWQTMDCSLEELVVALADTLWKGKRDEGLENKIVDEISRQLNRERWGLFIELDSCFEFIASPGEDRLRRSRVD